jgi:hypothetical protein
VVVFRIADADHIMRRQRHALQRGGEAGRLIDVRRQNHYRTFVEDDLQF